MRKEVVLATKNPAKLERYKFLFPEMLHVKQFALHDFSELYTPEEPFFTAEENALAKAKEYYNQIGKPIFACDEALYVDHLPEDRQPGVFPRRIIDRKTEATDEQILEYWMNHLREHPASGGFWRHAFVLYSPEKMESTTVDRRFTFVEQPHEKEVRGYPMSRICKDEIAGSTYASLSSEEREKMDKIAFAQVTAMVREFYGE